MLSPLIFRSTLEIAPINNPLLVLLLGKRVVGRGKSTPYYRECKVPIPTTYNKSYSYYFAFLRESSHPFSRQSPKLVNLPATGKSPPLFPTKVWSPVGTLILALTTSLIARRNPVGRVALRNMFALFGRKFLLNVWQLYVLRGLSRQFARR